MFKLSFFSLLFLALLNLVTATSVTYWKSKEGYFYYHGEVPASNDAGFKTAVVQAYHDMVADIQAYNTAHRTTYKVPMMMTGIFDGSTVTLGSSVQGYTGNVEQVPADFPQALKDIMTQVSPGECHRHEGLCAEPMALATYVLKKGKLPDSATTKVATYGQPPSASAPSPQNPCSSDGRGYGCKELLQKLELTYFPKMTGGHASTSTATTSSKPPTGKHRRAIANEIQSLLLRVRDLQVFDDYLAKREFLMAEEEYF
jgi:hypothetical protein